jgi:hypothetical protein
VLEEQQTSPPGHIPYIWLDELQLDWQYTGQTPAVGVTAAGQVHNVPLYESTHGEEQGTEVGEGIGVEVGIGVFVTPLLFPPLVVGVGTNPAHTQEGHGLQEPGGLVHLFW